VNLGFRLEKYTVICHFSPALLCQKCLNISRFYRLCNRPAYIFMCFLHRGFYTFVTFTKFKLDLYLFDAF
jgi:hypothetical protein